MRQGMNEKRRNAWGDEMREEEWERYDLHQCGLVGLSHQPSVILALIAEDQLASV